MAIVTWGVETPIPATTGATTVLHFWLTCIIFQKENVDSKLSNMEYLEVFGCLKLQQSS